VNTQNLLILAVWLIFLTTLGRAAVRGKLSDPGGRRIWLLYLLSILAFTFWGEAAEASLDRHFNNLPVALYLKYVCLIWVCHLYLHMLQEVGSAPQRCDLLCRLPPVAIGLGLFSLIAYALLAPVAAADLRYLVIGARDAVVLVFIVFGFLAGTLAMWRQERVAAMRLKQTAILLFFASYAISTFGSISAALMTLFQVGDADAAARALQPFLYPAICFFVLMLIPYRWYAGLLYIQRLATYYRLKRLERVLIRRSGSRPDPHAVGWLLPRPDELEVAIYRTVISILDGYLILQDTQPAHGLLADLQRCITKNRDYSNLVGALAAVRL
jgi:hypothetical protein